MTRQSAPSWAACAPSAASPAGAFPYTYCQAQTCRPAALSAETKLGLNCDHQLVPSELLTITVVIPYWCAWAAIDAGVPPLAWLTYQIHIALPSNAVPDAPAGGDADPLRCSRRTVTRSALERAPWRPVTYSVPEIAVAGARAISRFEPCLRAATAERPRRWPRRTVKTTFMPRVKGWPASSTVPPG